MEHGGLQAIAGDPEQPNWLVIEIIDQAAAGAVSHLLIDRFRFDSFVPASDGDENSKLLTLFGDLVYMFFMITPLAMRFHRVRFGPGPYGDKATGSGTRFSDLSGERPRG